VRDAVVAGMTRASQDETGVRVEMEDWGTAIQSMHHSNTAVFGSSLHVPEPLAPSLQPLVENQIKDILKSLTPLLPYEARTERHNNISRMSYMIYGTDPNGSQFLNLMISRGLLSSPDFSKISLFVLSEEKLFVRPGKHIATINKVVSQVLDSVKPSILFIPRIDLLERILDQQQQKRAFYSQLKRIHGSNTLILATSNIAKINELSEEMKGVFDLQERLYVVRKATTEERKNFFSQILQDPKDDDEDDPLPKRKKKSSRKKNSSTLDIAKYLKSAVEITDGELEDDMCRLYEALSRVMEDFLATARNQEDIESCHESIDLIFENYNRTKLSK
jgi:hypothetical protein